MHVTASKYVYEGGLKGLFLISLLPKETKVPKASLKFLVKHLIYPLVGRIIGNQKVYFWGDGGIFFG